MNIDWNELPKNVVCICAYNDFSGLFNCYIDECGNLLTTAESYEVDLSKNKLIAVNPNASPDAFAKAVVSVSEVKIFRLEGEIKNIKKDVAND